MTEVLATSESLNSEEIQNNELRTQDSADLEQNNLTKEYHNRDEIVARLQSLIELPVDDVKEEIESLKQGYYKLRKRETDQAKADFIPTEEQPEFVMPQDELEASLKALLSEFKNKKAAVQEEKENLRKENLQKKQAILEQLQQFCSDTDNINRHYNEFVELTKQFKEIGEVPAPNVTDIWRQYQACTETFYDRLKINKELRDYDFKKNLEHKEALLAEIEKLANNEDIVSSYRQLLTLQDDWRRTGPVAINLRDELWARYKDLTSQIYKRHQAYYEDLKEKEESLNVAKTDICEKIEALSLDGKTPEDWEKQTQEISALIENFRKLGYTQNKNGRAIFERYHEACHRFYDAKNQFFKARKEAIAEKIALKIDLVEQVEALKDSSEWKETMNKIIDLQKKWKEIGAVNTAQGNSLWKRFNSACNYFFARKTKTGNTAETENLTSKKAILQKLNEFVESESMEGNLQQELRELMNQWNSIGHVPFKEKDVIYKEYQHLLDVLFARINNHGRQKNLKNFAASVIKQADGNMNELYREREKLMRAYERLTGELKTYENNLGFLSSSSKGASVLVKELERKMSNLKEEINVIAQKVNLIDEKFQ